VSNSIPFRQLNEIMTNQFKAMTLLENSMLKKEYLMLFIFLIFVIFLTVLIIGVSYLVARQIPESEKLSAYECGFEPYEDTRHTFDIRFCVIAILFIVRALKKLFTGFNLQIDVCKLKGLVRYCNCVLESILRVVFSIIYKVIQSEKKAAVSSLSKILIYLKKDIGCLRNLIIAFLFNLEYSCFVLQQFFLLKKLRKGKIYNNFAGYIDGILCKCTSYNRFLFVAGETRQYFSILIKELKNELALDIKNIKKVDTNQFLNDDALFYRAV
jgi:NADH:ubiquinone oxidoreductase subunit 3 (subunit A)